MFAVVVVIVVAFLLAVYMAGLFLIIAQSAADGRCAQCAESRRNWAALSQRNKMAQALFYGPILLACTLIGCAEEKPPAE